MSISINENNRVVTHRGQPALERSRLAAILLLNQTNAFVRGNDLFDFSSSRITRPVVYHDDFKFAFVVGRKKGAQSRADYLRFVIGCDHHADRYRYFGPG